MSKPKTNFLKNLNKRSRKRKLIVSLLSTLELKNKNAIKSSYKKYS